MSPRKSPEEIKQMLQNELEREKQRFNEASARAASVIRGNLSVTKWFQDHPVESALFTVAGAVILYSAVTRPKLAKQVFIGLAAGVARSVSQSLRQPGGTPLQRPPLRSV